MQWDSSQSFKMRTDSFGINKRSKKWGKYGGDRCEGFFMNRINVETSQHLIIECSQYEIARTSLEREIMEEIGVSRWQQAKAGEGGGMDNT